MFFLYTILIAPLELLFEVLFMFLTKAFNNYGLSIIGLSAGVTILTLPLYHVAEKIQQKERDERKRLEPGIRRIKETFKGDEQFMILSTYYRQNRYHPAYVLRGSLGLLIQVPFFIAAYHFLSNLGMLQGTSLSVIRDLGKPDQLVTIGALRVNLLPVLMTGINLVSGIIYTRGFAFRDKAQIYGMALLFLLLLYTSPAALVLYWTLNNLFSLVKNLFYTMKKPLTVAYLLLVAGVLGTLGVLLTLHSGMTNSKKAMLLLMGISVVSLPLIARLGAMVLKTLNLFVEKPRAVQYLFFLSVIVLFLLSGLVIPSNLIASSVIEFSNIGIAQSPLSFIAYTLLFFIGVWIVWPAFIFRVSNASIQAVLAVGMSLIALTAVINTFLFPGDYGVISHLLQFENPNLLNAHGVELFLPLITSVILGVLIITVLHRGRTKSLTSLLTILIVALAGSGIVKATVIQKEYNQYSEHLSMFETEVSEEIQPVYHFSKEGRNVLFIFLDRAVSSYFPIIIEEFPELKDQFKGFTFYPNTISFGNMTAYGAPPMMGGYEYTLEALDKRKNEKLVDKHNESLLVLPKLFGDAGYSVTLNDPPFSNYVWEGDFTPFKPYPEMDVLYLQGPYADIYRKEHAEQLDWTPEHESTVIKKYLPMFIFLKAAYPVAREAIYEKGRYFLTLEEFQSLDKFLNYYSHLYYLPGITAFDGVGDVYINVSNDTTHNPTRFQTPEYEPRSTITYDVTALHAVEGIRGSDLAHYYVNVAALKRIGLWFDQLREAGVYHNTRIVIVSDHGTDVYSEMTEIFDTQYAYNGYVPLFLTKDFDEKGALKSDDTFMTNADAPLFAIKDLTSPTNPFTGKNLFEAIQKEQVNVYHGPFDPRTYTGTTYSPILDASYSIKENIFVEANWGPVEHKEQAQ